MEFIVIACILLDEKNEYLNLDLLDINLFDIENRGLVKKAIDWRQSGKPFDIIVFGLEIEIGKETVQHIAQGLDKISHISNYPSYYKLLQEFSEQGKFQKICHEFLTTGKINKENLSEFIENIKNPDNISEDYEVSGSSVEIGKYQEFFNMRAKGNIKTYKLYMPELDKLIGKIYPGSSITIGARSSKGKSAFLLQVFYEQVKNGIPAIYISSEMASRSLLDRIVSRVTNIDYYNIRNGFTTSAENERIIEETNKMKDYPFYFHISSSFDIKKIVKFVRQTKAEMVFLDYVQRFQLPGKYDTRASAFSTLANDLKTIALDNNIVCISASQLNKANDLKESMGIYEAADTVILIQDNGVDSMKSKNVDLNVDKNRDGRTGIENYIFQKYKGNFEYLRMSINTEISGNDFKTRQAGDY